MPQLSQDSPVDAGSLYDRAAMLGAVIKGRAVDGKF